MEEKAKPRDDRHGLLWTELQEKAKGDPRTRETTGGREARDRKVQRDLAAVGGFLIR